MRVNNVHDPTESAKVRFRALIWRLFAGKLRPVKPPARPSLAAWLLLGAAAVLHLALLVGWRWQQPLVPYFFDATVLSGGRGLDFYSIYQAGYNARHGLDIYEGDPALVPVVVPYFTPYRYLPVVAYTVGAGLSLLSPLNAYKLWVVVIELALLSCVAITYAVTRREPDLFARLATMWLVFTPFYMELFMGQFSMVQAAFVWGMFVVGGHNPTMRADERADWSLRRLFDGLWIASVLWKITTVLYTPIYVRWRRWQPVAIAAALGLATTVPYFLLFPAHWPDFVRNNAGGRVAGHELGNLGLRQLVYEALAVAGAPAGVQPVVQLALVAAVLAAALWVTWRAPRPPLVGALALWTTVFFLVSPQVWEHHYVMLLPALVGLYAAHRSRLVLLVWLLLALPTPFGFIGLEPVIAANHDLRAFALQPAWQPLLQHASKSVPALVLFVHAARLVARAGGQRAPQS
jgi:hypothetical protein